MTTLPEARRSPTQRRGRSLRRTRRFAYVGIYALMAVAVVYALFPILWGISTSFKTTPEVNAWPPTWIPDDITLENYRRAVFGGKFMLYLRNTAFVVACSSVVSLLLSAHAAYAVTRWNFRGKDTMLMLMWATIMIPGVAIIVPLYLFAIDVGLYDTLWVLVLVYSAWAVPTLVWLLRGFINNIPVELEESALIDGCTPMRAFYRITLPLTRSGLVAGAVLVFVLIWNEFLIGYSLVLSDAHRIIQVGVYFFVSEVGIQWDGLMAAAMAAIVPIIVAYAFMQKAFIQGLTAGAVKG